MKSLINTLVWDLSYMLVFGLLVLIAGNMSGCYFLCCLLPAFVLVLPALCCWLPVYLQLMCWSPVCWYWVMLIIYRVVTFFAAYYLHFSLVLPAYLLLMRWSRVCWLGLYSAKTPWIRVVYLFLSTQRLLSASLSYTFVYKIATQQ